MPCEIMKTTGLKPVAHYIAGESCYQSSIEEVRDYLPQLHAAANYRVVDDVASLPVKVSAIYLRLAS